MLYANRLMALRMQRERGQQLALDADLREQDSTEWCTETWLLTDSHMLPFGLALTSILTSRSQLLCLPLLLKMLLCPAQGLGVVQTWCWHFTNDQQNWETPKSMVHE